MNTTTTTNDNNDNNNNNNRACRIRTERFRLRGRVPLTEIRLPRIARQGGPAELQEGTVGSAKLPREALQKMV